jgi:hypothetical protein
VWGVATHSIGTARLPALRGCLPPRLAHAPPSRTLACLLPSQVREVAMEAVQRARRGEGPTLIECETYRFRGHSLADPDELRRKEEKEHYQVGAWGGRGGGGGWLRWGHGVAEVGAWGG